MGECDEDYSDFEDCSRYNGACYKTCANPTGNGDPRGCGGPTDYDCFDCIAHAHRSVDGQCTCDECWGCPDEGAACSHYTCECDHRCANGCHGPTNADCQECVENAEGTPCDCIAGYGGE